MTNYHEEIRDFIITNLLFGDGAGLEDDTSFLESGVVDSTGVLELIMFLEQTYKIKIAPEEMVPENLDSVNRMAQFLTRKLAGAIPPQEAAEVNRP
jgi:acyl carrier protein